MRDEVKLNKKKKTKKHSQFINGEADEGNGKQTSAAVR